MAEEATNPVQTVPVEAFPSDGADGSAGAGGRGRPGPVGPGGLLSSPLRRGGFLPKALAISG